MQQEEGIIVLLAIALLSICYFSPLTNGQGIVEGFANILNDSDISTHPTGRKNPQGSIGTVPSSFHPGRAVRQVGWKANTGAMNPSFQQTGAGNPRSYNMGSDGTMSSFPFMEQSRTNDSANEKISLIKPDGVTLGGYLPQIIRPFDNITAQSKDSSCNFPCYSDIKHQKWCNEENAVKYYGMRPLINPSTYNQNLLKMFNHLIDKNVPAGMNPNDDAYAAVFCTETESSIMSWLMQKIAIAVSKMPEMQRNGTWKSERFYETDVQLYQFVGENGQVNFKIVFNLYNPLRSVATLVEATVYLVGGKPVLKHMGFVNDGEMGDYMAPENGWGAINAQNVTSSEKGGFGIEMFEPLGVAESPQGMQMWEAAKKQDPNEFDWNYQNTLEVQKFNKYGFYSNVPGGNVKIEGGVPESLRGKLRHCKEDNLMSCATPGFTGVVAVSASSLNQHQKMPTMDQIAQAREAGVPTVPRPAALNGEVKNVYDNPQLIYSVPTQGLRDTRIDTIEQKGQLVGEVWT